MAITKNEVMEWIDQATMLEISDLVKNLEEKYGISAAAGMPSRTTTGGWSSTSATTPRSTTPACSSSSSTSASPAAT